mmetsp:Transcript_58702/g.116583  ORF Transcript_58702/g.116583 Transcript_58702/m.116583 type:complete len:213 (+) Transcript_58702:1666-2304(+)
MAARQMARQSACERCSSVSVSWRKKRARTCALAVRASTLCAERGKTIESTPLALGSNLPAVVATSSPRSSRSTCDANVWSTTCELVPPKPKPLAPTITSPAGSAVSSVASFSPMRSKLMRWLGRAGLLVSSVTCIVLGTRRWLATRLALMMAAIPAAHSRWPMLALALPTSTGADRTRTELAEAPPPSPRTRPIASSSIGSPRGVPVPCAST